MYSADISIETHNQTLQAGAAAFLVKGTVRWNTLICSNIGRISQGMEYMAHYQIKVEDIVKRQHIIKQKCKSPLRVDRFFYYVADGIDLPVVSLSLELPVYRMENYRTRTRQRAYIHSHNKPVGYFLKGEEDTSAQRAQHELLIELANRIS